MSEWDEMHDFEDRQDCMNANFELNGNKLLSEIELKEQDITHDEMCSSDDSRFSTTGSNGLGLSPEVEANQHYDGSDNNASSEVLAKVSNNSNGDESLRAKHHLQGQEEDSILGITMEPEKQCYEDALNFEEDLPTENKTLEVATENEDTNGQNDDFDSILDPPKDAGAIDEESDEKRDCLNPIPNNGDEGDHSEENEDSGSGEFWDNAEEKVNEVLHGEIDDNATEVCSGKVSKHSIGSDLDVANENKNFDQIVKDDMEEEEESEYQSVASHRYSSFESLDDAFTRKTSHSGKDLLLGSEFETDAGTRSIHGSEADRTDDDYLTCEERSIVGVNGQTADDRDYDNEQQICFSNYEVTATGSLVNEDLRLRSSEVDDDDDGDYGGYETQDYLTADEQSEFDGGADNIRCSEKEENVLETTMKQTKLIDSRGEGVASVEKGEATDGEEYATADEERKEDEDDRSTVVGSDNEETECHMEVSNEIGIIDTDILKSTDAEGLNEKKDISPMPNEMVPIQGEDNEVAEKGSGIKEEDDKCNFGIDGDEEKPIRRKKSFFSSMMAKKEAKFAEKLFNYNQRYEIALEGTAQANDRFKKAKSDLPLMIIEKRIPKVEELQRKSDKLEEAKTRLESYLAHNKSINDFIQSWRTTEGSVHDRKAEFYRCSNKTSERQKLLMACKKRQSYLHSELIRQDDIQLHKKRRIQQLTERLDMLNLRQTEQRNLAKKRIDEAKKYCELSVREAAKVVVASKRLGALKLKEKELEDRLFNSKKELKKARQKRKEKEFEVERANIQKSVKAMKKERGW